MGRPLYRNHHREPQFHQARLPDCQIESRSLDLIVVPRVRDVVINSTTRTLTFKLAAVPLSNSFWNSGSLKAVHKETGIVRKLIRRFPPLLVSMMIAPLLHEFHKVPPLDL
jgi:hypothetical protein